MGLSGAVEKSLGFGEGSAGKGFRADERGGVGQFGVQQVPAQGDQRPTGVEDVHERQ